MFLSPDGLRTVAGTAKAFNLSGINPIDAEAATNKIKMRKRFHKYKLPQPDFFGAASLKDVITGIKKLEFPVVIKPADSMGARGVKSIKNLAELKIEFPIV